MSSSRKWKAVRALKDIVLDQHWKLKWLSKLLFKPKIQKKLSNDYMELRLKIKSRVGIKNKEIEPKVKSKIGSGSYKVRINIKSRMSIVGSEI